MFLKCGYASIDQLTVDLPNARKYVSCCGAHNFHLKYVIDLNSIKMIDTYYTKT